MMRGRHISHIISGISNGVKLNGFIHVSVFSYIAQISPVNLKQKRDPIQEKYKFWEIAFGSFLILKECVICFWGLPYHLNLS